MEILPACEQPIPTFTSLAQSIVTCDAELGNTYLKLREARQVAGRAHYLTHTLPRCYNDFSVQ